MEFWRERPIDRQHVYGIESVIAGSRVRELETEGVFVVQNKVTSAFPEGLILHSKGRPSLLERGRRMTEAKNPIPFRFTQEPFRA